MEVKKNGQPMLFQIYLNTDREKSKELIKKVEDMKFDGIIFTVGAFFKRFDSACCSMVLTTSFLAIDSPVPGNRELDRRTKPVQREVRLVYSSTSLSLSW